MTTVVLRGLLERKGRTLSTLLAVVFGVALIAGTYVFTDTINRSFDRLIADTNDGIDVKVLPREQAVDGNEQPTLDQALVDRVRGVSGVAEASGALNASVAIVDERGERLTSGAPSFAVSTGPDRFDPFTYDGRPPRTADEVALDASSAQRGSFALGDRVRIAGNGPAKAYRLVGIGSLGSASSIGGASVAVLTLPEVQRIAQDRGRVSEVDVAAAQGVSPEALRDRVRAEVGGGLDVRTGEQDTSEQSADVSEGLGFLTTLLLVFGFISLVVGAFSIFNTFSITVAQRMRQFALLRTVGATRRQVLRAVVVEALVIGLVGALLGLAVGIGLAPALNAMFEASGLDLPSSGIVIAPRTIVVSLLVGVLATLLASIVPAVRATKVPPVAALRQGAVLTTERPGRRRTILGAALVALGLALIVVGLTSGGDATSVIALMGAGALVVFIGVALLSNLLVGPLAALVGAPLERVGGVAGRLARGNAVRNPGRTAGTAASLMIGVAVVVLVTMLAAGIKASFSGAFEEAVAADLVVTDATGELPAALGPALQGVPGVAAASGLTGSSAQLVRGAEDLQVSGLDPATAPRVLRVPWEEGSDATLRALGAAGAAVDRQWAQEHDLGVGSTFALRTPTDAVREFTVRGVYDDRGGLFGPVTLDQRVVRETFGARRDQIVLIEVAGDEAAAGRGVQELLRRDFPAVESQTGEEFVDAAVGQVDQIVTLFYALLSLAVIIAVMGIANTLALSVYERTRELGLLRAIGATRRQVRRMVRGEAVITALIGGIVGLVVGLAFSVIVSRPLADEGFALTVPVGTLLAILVVATLCGLLAALSPARRASRTNVLEALHYE